MRSFIIAYYIKKFGARQFVQMIMDTYMPGFHISKNPRKRISDEVMETRISL